MICNLNQMSFQEYGVIHPERGPEARRSKDLPNTQFLSLTQGPMQVYYTRSDTWICCRDGSTVLSVSMDNQHYAHYYLDKPVYVKPGVYFCLSPFLGESTAEFSASMSPSQEGQRDPVENLSVRHNFQVDAIYTFFYQEKEQGFFFPGEAHPMAELTYVDQGTLHSVADGQDLRLEQGDLVLYAPDQWHMQYADIGVAPRFISISFDVSGPGLSPVYNRKFKAPPTVTPLLERMCREQESPDGFSNDMLLHLLSMALLELLRSDAAPAAKVETARTVHSENEIIRRAQQYITANIRSKLSVPMVAQNVDVSPSYLTALFRKNMQISPGEYIRRMKLQESKQMIRENNMSFTDIAAALHYSTVHHFSRQFKEKFGITPTEYARSVRG